MILCAIISAVSALEKPQRSASTDKVFTVCRVSNTGFSLPSLVFLHCISRLCSHNDEGDDDGVRLTLFEFELLHGSVNTRQPYYNDIQPVFDPELR